MKADAKEGMDGSRRKWLLATSVAGAIAGVSTLVPFVNSFAPSERVRAAGAPVTVYISDLMPANMVTVAWRGMPVFQVNRTKSMLSDVVKANPLVADPSTDHPFSTPLPTYCRNEYRASKSPEPPGCCGSLHASWMHIATEISAGPTGQLAGRLARRLPVSVPWLYIRPRRSCLQE